MGERGIQERLRHTDSNCSLGHSECSVSVSIQMSEPLDTNVVGRRKRRGVTTDVIESDDSLLLYKVWVGGCDNIENFKLGQWYGLAFFF